MLGYAEEKKDNASKLPSVRSLLKDARASIKNNRDQKNKEKTLLEALNREDITNAEKADIYNMAACLEHSLNDQENLKAYLKQKYDTVNYYNTMLLASRYAILCDSIDSLPNHKGKVKVRYRTKDRDLLLLYRPNIYLGGRFFLKKADYAKTYDFMSMYADFHLLNTLRNHPKIKNDTLLSSSTYYAVLSAYNSKQLNNTLKYLDRAIADADSSRIPVLHEYKVRCLHDLKQDDEWMKQLVYGVEQYPKHDYFFTTLANYYETEQLFDRGIELADSMLRNVQDATIYWYTKSIMHLHKENWLESAAMADKVLAKEPEHINALYNKAVSYVNEAADYALTACNDIRNPKSRTDREHIQYLYRQAKHPSEEIRRLRPDATATWVPLLYRIYLNLNMGDEFSEIEKIMKVLKQ